MSHSNTPPVRNRAPLTARSSSLRCVSAAEHQTAEQHWRNIWLADDPVDVLNENLSLLVGRYVPTTVIRVRNKGKPWFDGQYNRAFGNKQKAHIRWTRDRSRVNWEQFVRCQARPR